MSMETLNKSVGLQVVGCHIKGCDPKKAVELGPHMAGELRPWSEIMSLGTLKRNNH